MRKQILAGLVLGSSLFVPACQKETKTTESPPAKTNATLSESSDVMPGDTKTYKAAKPAMPQASPGGSPKASGPAKPVGETKK